MHSAREVQKQHPAQPSFQPTLKTHSDRVASSNSKVINPHIAFEKNYPKNIFITLIQHLAELGFKAAYEECVGTRESFESKNVVSLAEIHKVISQNWFQESINLTALISNMSNKILMNSKIKKKLFHLLLIKDLFELQSPDCKQFKKLVSRKANEVTTSQLPNHPLLNHPSALIYLLRLFAEGMQKDNKETLTEYQDSDQFPIADDEHKLAQTEEYDFKFKSKEASSKEEYKFYITKIITSFNHFSGQLSELLDLVREIKFYIEDKQEEIRQRYRLPKFVPEWNYFGSIVIDNCLIAKKNRQKLTFSTLNQWIQEFRELATSHRGFVALTELPVEEEASPFRPIILIQPPIEALQ